jgi:uncharacterized protein (UPF0332 family)
LTLNGADVVSFNAQEFFQLSLRLVKNEPNEAGYRTAINRAYYACHLIGCESAAKKGWFTPKYTFRDHAGLWAALKEHTPWWNKLRALYELREHADYHMDPSQQPPNSCSYCDSKTDDIALVDEDIWVIARDIANDIIPRLQSIMP